MTGGTPSTKIFLRYGNSLSALSTNKISNLGESLRSAGKTLIQQLLIAKTPNTNKISNQLPAEYYA